MSSYGKRGGTGATAGRTATIYLVGLPDGTEVKKRSFFLTAPTLYAGIYKIDGAWKAGGLYETQQAAAANYSNVTLAKRLDSEGAPA